MGGWLQARILGTIRVAWRNPQSNLAVGKGSTHRLARVHPKGAADHVSRLVGEQGVAAAEHQARIQQLQPQAQALATLTDRARIMGEIAELAAARRAG